MYSHAVVGGNKFW